MLTYSKCFLSNFKRCPSIAVESMGARFISTQLPVTDPDVYCLSMSGCGFLGVYHFGAIQCLQKHGSGLLKKVKRCSGASAGSLVAALLVLCPDELNKSLDHLYSFAEEVQGLKLGALTPQYSIIRRLRDMLEEIIPIDGHLLANGRLHVSVTKISDKTNRIISQFDSRQYLIEVLVASCYIPVYAGVGEKYPVLEDRNEYADGGITENLPRFSDATTITISPFSGEADISPRDVTIFDWTMRLGNQLMKVNMLNVVRGAQALFPPRKHILEEYYKLGFIDSMNFLRRKNWLQREEGSPV